MQEISQVTEFGKVFLFLIMGALFLLLTFFLGHLVSLKKPNPEKLSSYECGEEPVGSSWIQFNSRFYVIALIFLLFDVELAFIFPWTTIFGQPALLQADPRWGWLTLIEMFIFIGILILGLIYVWVKGDLEWIKPMPLLPVVETAIPPSAYENINKEIYTIRSFNNDQIISKPEPEVSIPAPGTTPKPAFKPVFRKPAPK
ncbi:MAG TPA: NADH-quinone oxidoreductase subunit A [Sphingobacteriaceae bacterium]|nr:NADH-quinone oxidoreductase subunit A [Sphingobacteriaceae bacterium]